MQNSVSRRIKRQKPAGPRKPHRPVRGVVSDRCLILRADLDRQRLRDGNLAVFEARRHERANVGFVPPLIAPRLFLSFGITFLRRCPSRTSAERKRQNQQSQSHGADVKHLRCNAKAQTLDGDDVTRVNTVVFLTFILLQNWFTLILLIRIHESA